MCFYVGANSIFYGEELLTTPNNDDNRDNELLAEIFTGVNGEEEQKIA
jgi:biotin synthase-like enzyme